MNVVCHPAAAAEHFDHIIHYKSLNAILSTGYVEEFERAISYIGEGVTRFPVVEAPNVRRHYLSRFPIAIYFRDCGEDIQILAVSHKRRRPSHWTARL